MTNYNKWDKFDPDMVCLEIEKQQEVESFKTAKKKVFQATASENEQSILEAKRNAEALQSQADVAALKAKGGMSGRRRAKAKDDSAGSKEDESVSASTQLSPPAPPKARTLADRLHAITDFLFRLLKQVEQIRVCTEKKQSHNEGYIACMRCLQDIHAFSRIKNATVMAALRATSSSAASDNTTGEAPTHRPDATVKIIEDLNESESFLIEQTINCLSLFALSRGEYALSVECARYVLKRQGEHADAGIWIMRGLALAALGAPYLTKLHFASAHSVNSEYAGLKECTTVVEKGVVVHARLTVKCSREELVSREVAHSILSFFRSKAHLLQTIPDLAVITPVEVNNMLQEGSVHSAEVTAVLGTYTTTKTGNIAGTEKGRMDTKVGANDKNSTLNNKYGEKSTDISTLHVDEETSHLSPTTNTATTTTSSNNANVNTSCTSHMTCATIDSMLLQYITSHTSVSNTSVSSKTVGFPYSILLHTLRHLLQPIAANSEQVQRVLSLLAGLNIVRKLFYEAQVLYLESIYQTAEIKYSAAIMLLHSLENTLTTLEPTSEAIKGTNLSQLLSHGLGLNPISDADPVVMKWADVKLYVKRLQSACFVNIATCMCQHSVRLNMIVPTTTTTATTTASATCVSITSVADLVGPTSVLSTPLHYVTQGLSLLDTLSGRFRKLFVLEKMHRFTEGLAECKYIQQVLQSKDYTTLTGCFVAHDLIGSGLGQEYIPGFVLPMPVASVLAQSDNAASSAILIDSTSESEKAETDLLLEKEFDTIAGGNEEDAKLLLSCSPAASDAAVSKQVWQLQLQKKIDMFEFLIRKHGVK